MADNKTRPTDQAVAAFIAAIPDPQRRQDCDTLVTLMQKAARAEPKMWGSSIVGFGQYHYVYESGREGDSILVGFSPRKSALTLYIHGGLDELAPLLEKLGKYKTGKGCLYVSKLDDIHLPTPKKILERSVKAAKKLDRA